MDPACGSEAVRELRELVRALRGRLSRQMGGIPAWLPAASPAEVRPETREEDRAVLDLDQVRKLLGDCTRCRLHRGRRTLVFGQGDPKARLMFVGEGPGAEEDRRGLAFVGKAGQLLTRIIAAIGLGREEVYITNIVKCRPPGNRDPEEDEVATCLPFLQMQIRAVRPRIICALGAPAARTLLNTREPISRLRGRFFDREGLRVMPTYHPAYLLRNPEAKRPVWEDMQKIQRAYREGT